MSVEVDPQEVLRYLHELGFNDIQPDRFEEFMKDLKKLIKYDLAKKKKYFESRAQCEEDSTTSTLPNTTDESPSPRSPPPVTAQRIHRRHYDSVKDGSVEAACSSSSESSDGPARIVRECLKLTAQKNQQKENVLKEKPVQAENPSKSCDCLWRRYACKGCEKNWSKEQGSVKTVKSKENLAPPRPKSSFIRSWQLTGQPRPGTAPQRSDPVALYHQYQQMWKQQKLPGENNHNDLRWTIRERMLGQEPHPRPLSQASSLSSVNRQRKRL